MNVSEFHFDLPEELIAQEALQDRAASKLLVLNRANGEMVHSQVSDIGQFLKAGDLLVFNNSKVLPARLLGKRESDELAVECFLLKRMDDRTWQALLKPGKKISVNDKLVFEKDGNILHGSVTEKFDDGKTTVAFEGNDVIHTIQMVGHMPLPPYIKRPDTLIDQERYQTVYAKELGSVAAPTAGLHFTDELIAQLKEQGIDHTEVTLHVGYGTFKPVRVEVVEEHEVDEEIFEISQEAAGKINQALAEGRRVIAVGTTTTRTLETSAAQNSGKIAAGLNSSKLFIYPGYKFQIISGLMTNFHLPESSLLMLVAAFAGQDKVLAAYGEAVKNKYRFYSYGDAMLIV